MALLLVGHFEIVHLSKVNTPYSAYKLKKCW